VRFAYTNGNYGGGAQAPPPGPTSDGIELSFHNESCHCIVSNFCVQLHVTCTISIYSSTDFSKKCNFSQVRILTVAKVARATVRFFPPRIFRGSPLLDTGLACYVRKTVVNLKLRSQLQNATVSGQKIVQLLLNIVTFCHGAVLQTNHRASCGHVRHGGSILIVQCKWSTIKFDTCRLDGIKLHHKLGWKLLKSLMFLGSSSKSFNKQT
jgi:hypothetical protein